MSTYLVTGGAGFIGSHIVDRLVKDRHVVRVFDNFFAGKESNIAHNMDHIELIRGDLRSLEDVTRAVDGMEYILHQAGMRSVPMSVENPYPYNDVNVTGQLNLLMAARDAGVKRLVFASSSSVYGSNPVLPKQEDMLPRPISPYAATKLAGEAYCSMFTELYGLETVSLRYFNVFGPRQDPASQYAAVIPKFIESILRDERPIIFGDGLQSRDFTYVQNNVEANLATCIAPDTAGKVFNIACGECYSLLDIVAAINELLGKSIEPVFDPPRAGDMKHTQADITRAREIIGFNPSVSFMEGLERTVQFIRKNCC